MRITLPTLAVVLALGCHPQPKGVYSSAREDAFQGTYEIAVCKPGRCVPGDTARAIAWGTLVLLDHVLPPIPDSAARYLDDFSGDANACYVLNSRGDDNDQSWAGLSPVGAVIWQRASRSAPIVSFELYASPDARHRVHARIDAEHLAGRGHSTGAPPVEVDWPPDTVVGRRVGPPDITPCVAASARKWRERRSSRSPAVTR